MTFSALLTRKEDEQFDRTRSIESRDSVGEAIAAFATSSGGTLLIGQDKDNQTVVGIPDEAELVGRLGEILRNCQPIPSTEGPDFFEKEGKKLAVLRVIALGKGGPCFYKSVPYMRVMDSNKKIAGPELYRIWSKSGRISFEERRSSATLQDIESGVLEFYTAPLKTRGDFNLQGWLERKKLADGSHLTNLGCLMLAKDPSHFLSRPKMTLIRYRGTDTTERLSVISLSSSIHRLLPALESFIRANLQVIERQQGLRKTSDLIIPWAVLREGLINAIAHRDYESPSETLVRIFDDRLEIINPGAPDPEVWKKIQSLRWPVHRNPMVYEFLRLEGVGEGAGQGIPLIGKTMAQAGLPEPQFEVASDSFMLVLRSVPPLASSSKNRLRAELDGFLRQKKEVRTVEVMGALKISRPTAIRLMRFKMNEGTWYKSGRTAKTVYHRVK